MVQRYNDDNLYRDHHMVFWSLYQARNLHIVWSLLYCRAHKMWNRWRILTNIPKHLQKHIIVISTKESD